MPEREQQALWRAAEKEECIKAWATINKETKLDSLKENAKELQKALEEAKAKVTLAEQLNQAEKRWEDEVMRICMEVEQKSLHELETPLTAVWYWAGAVAQG